MNTLLTHRVDGAGDPALLLNGGMMTLSNWDSAVEGLQGRKRTPARHPL